MSKTEYLIWQRDTSLHLATSLRVRNEVKNNTDVTDYFAGDNEIYE